MSKLKAFAVHDSKAEAFMTPFFFQTSGQAIRSFSDAVNGGQEQLTKHAADFTLFEVGVFDQDLGRFEPSEPKSLGNGVTFRTEVE